MTASWGVILMLTSVLCVISSMVDAVLSFIIGVVSVGGESSLVCSN